MLDLDAPVDVCAPATAPTPAERAADAALTERRLAAPAPLVAVPAPAPESVPAHERQATLAEVLALDPSDADQRFSLLGLD